MRRPEGHRRRIEPIDEDAREKLSILHLIVTLGESNAQYNEHCLPQRTQRDITICSYSRASVSVPPSITLFEGDGTIRGFADAMDRAFAERSYDVVHAHAPGSAAMLMLSSLRDRRRMSNAVLTVHNSRESFSLRNQVLLLMLFAAFPTVVFCSRAAMASFPPSTRRFARNVVVVPNGVDTDRVDRVLAGGVEGPGEPGFHVVCVGRLIPRKDPRTVLRAFALVAGGSDRLTFVGDGRLQGELFDEGRRAGLGSQVAVTGSVAREDVYRILSRADLFVSASHQEGLPVAVLEAMACGLPIVISDIDPHREISTGLVGSRLVPPGDVSGFAREIRRSRAMTVDERKGVGARCREVVDRRFDLPSMHQAYGEVYERVRRSPAQRARLPVGREVG